MTRVGQDHGLSLGGLPPITQGVRTPTWPVETETSVGRHSSHCFDGDCLNHDRVMMRGWGRVDTRRRGINMSHRCSDACREAVVN